MSAGRFLRTLIAGLPAGCRAAAAAVLALCVAADVAVALLYARSPWGRAALVAAGLAMQAGGLWWSLGTRRAQRWTGGAR